MVIQEAIDQFKHHQKSTVKKSTLKSYGKFIEHFQSKFANFALKDIAPPADYFQIGSL